MTIQEQRRKAFEECFPLHEGIQWCGCSIGYAPKTTGSAYEFVGLMAIASMANGQLTAWTAALNSVEVELPRQSAVEDLMLISDARKIIESAGVRVKP